MFIGCLPSGYSLESKEYSDHWQVWQDPQAHLAHPYQSICPHSGVLDPHQAL